MFFQTYKPASPLCDFIANLWIYNGFEAPRLKERIFPSGTFELVFNLRGDKFKIYKDAHTDQQCLSGAMVSGPHAGFFVVDSSEEASVMGAHFKPGGAFPFLGFSGGELTDRHVGLDVIWPRAASEIRDRLFAATSPSERFQLLERWLLSHLFRPLERHPAVSLALEGFRHDHSRAVVRNLARSAGLSDHRFIDVFRAEVGLKPKLFNRITRFQRVLARVDCAGAANWAQLAMDYGYFDQSHLIRDFLAFSGFSPAQYFCRLQSLRKKGLRAKFNHLPLAD